MNHQSNEYFYKLLRLSLGLSQEIPADLDADIWQHLYQTAVRQSLIGVCYQGMCLMSDACKPPRKVLVNWSLQAESIRELNERFYQRAAQLTARFAEKGHQSAILKGQANARLYPNKYARQPGDIDIWVEGGREKVLALFPKHVNASYHHVNLPANKDGIEVEVHFLPSSGIFNPLKNRRLQQWLEKEILSISQVEEGFFVPSNRFALVMQLAHIQKHFLAIGIGLRHVCDYYWLLRNATEEDRQAVASVINSFGLRHTAEALMWVLAEVLHLEDEKMFCRKDSYRGEWMLQEMMEGGNFGMYAQKQQHGTLSRILEKMRRHQRMLRFDFGEVLWLEVKFWEKAFRK